MVRTWVNSILSCLVQSTALILTLLFIRCLIVVAFIAPIYGFQDNIDYYRCSSCYYYLPGVAVPLYIINAEDDPFFDPNFFPTEESVDGGALAPIKLVRAKHGGHLGFMFHQLHKKEKDHDAVASWMPLELSRFIRHVIDSHSQ